MGPGPSLTRNTWEFPTPKTETAPGGQSVALERALEAMAEAGARFCSLQFIDLLGTVKSITIPADRVAHAVASGEWFDGSSVEGFARIFESDMYLKPDLATLRISSRSGAAAQAQVICGIYTPDGQPFGGDPRGVLARALAQAAERGYTYSVASELEFFLLQPEPSQGGLRPLPHDSAGYFDHALDLGSEVRLQIATALQELGIDVESSHHELAAGQHELDLAPRDALTAADHLVTARATVRAIARDRGLHATFMPKPFNGMAGSGMHTHQSLHSLPGGANAFANRTDEYHLSDVARHFIAGQLRHARALCAVVAPLVNSYKRLVPGFEAPIAVSWAQTNRSALIRVPRVSGSEQGAMRVEFRAPDPSCNPYLAFAAMLGAGLSGIEESLPLPPPIEENLYAFDPERFARYQLGLLPASLDEALKELRHDDVVRNALGAHVVERFIEAKEREWLTYARQVSGWELETYVESY
ncbi:MAG TPA: type I glutamate--ammonia ligase [Candidatus Limnocylindrales bacterium]|nr:type I glutamate--ammonia ligase [Candidatus Limnocylindrales bacterium]